MGKYSIGIDFGSLSVRALIVDVSDGKEIISKVCEYPNGCMSEALPSGVKLGVDWALQNAEDYISSMCEAVSAAVKGSAVDKKDIVGVGIDFTACTVVAAKSDGTPLSSLPEYKDCPHAYVKLWMHHAAFKQAERINAIGAELAPSWMKRYSGKMSSEFMYPKILQVVEEAPEIYDAADLFLEGGDWTVWQMTGNLYRNSCAAGYKAMWHDRDGYPSKEFFKALNPRMEDIVETKLKGDVLEVGSCAGGLKADMAEKMGLEEGTPVAVATIDGHCAYAGLGKAEPGTMMIIMGTSGCHMIIGEEDKNVPGICGCVKGGILPGFYGYEAGQSGFGTHFEWFTENSVPERYMKEAEEKKISIYQLMENKAAAYAPGETGLLILDWWNGNRSVINDNSLSGAIIGMTAQTKPEEIYRAIIEAMAFGTRTIVESFIESGVPVKEIVAVGGIAEKNPHLMQIFADILGMQIRLAGSSQGTALGAAVFGALVGGKTRGGYDNIFSAVNAIGKTKELCYSPDPEKHSAYAPLFERYRKLYHYFGIEEKEIMHFLKDRKSESKQHN